MIKGKTKSGFIFVIEEEKFNDFRTLKALAKADKGDTYAILEVVDRILGSEGTEKLEKHLETETGQVPVDKFFEEVREILDAASEQTKNSLPSPE